MSLNPEALRLHLDWWGKCLTCQHWRGDREQLEDGLCDQSLSDLGGQITTSEGWCKKWDSYAIDEATEILQAEEEAKDGDKDRIEAIHKAVMDLPTLKCEFCGSLNIYNWERCKGCKRKHWNSSDDTALGKELAQMARTNPTIARAEAKANKALNQLMSAVKDDLNEN